jgi:hypoxanthine phosphoribosyltransferase
LKVTLVTDSQKTSSPDQPFAHQIEEEFTRILDYYGIQWEYEPITFPLAWDDQGNVLEAFTPDFYLPEQDLYIELTTLRPSLTTKKNRKIRRLQELHPEIHIKLFKRVDLRQLMIKYGLDKEAGKITGSQAQK